MQQELAQLKELNPKLWGYVKTLFKFNVVGFDENMLLLPECQGWLQEKKISYETNNETLIWLPKLNPQIQSLLKN